MPLRRPTGPGLRGQERHTGTWPILRAATAVLGSPRTVPPYERWHVAGVGSAFVLEAQHAASEASTEQPTRSGWATSSCRVVPRTDPAPPDTRPIARLMEPATPHPTASADRAPPPLVRHERPADFAAYSGGSQPRSVHKHWPGHFALLPLVAYSHPRAGVKSRPHGRTVRARRLPRACPGSFPRFGGFAALPAALPATMAASPEGCALAALGDVPTRKDGRAVHRPAYGMGGDSPIRIEALEPPGCPGSVEMAGNATGHELAQHRVQAADHLGSGATEVAMTLGPQLHHLRMILGTHPRRR